MRGTCHYPINEDYRKMIQIETFNDDILRDLIINLFKIDFDDDVKVFSSQLIYGMSNFLCHKDTFVYTPPDNESMLHFRCNSIQKKV